MLQRREDALTQAISAASEPPVSTIAAAALARYTLGAIDLVRDQPEPRAALTEIFAILRNGWPGQ